MRSRFQPLKGEASQPQAKGQCPEAAFGRWWRNEQGKDLQALLSSTHNVIAPPYNALAEGEPGVARPLGQSRTA